MSFSYIDVGILILLVLISIKGIWQGLIRGLASFLGILLGVFFASRFYAHVGEWFASSIYDLHSVELHALVGFLLTLTLIWALFLFLGELLARMIRLTPLAVLDYAFGLLFGFCKAFLIISIIAFGVSQINWLKNFSQNLEQNSTLFPLMKNLSIHIMNLEQIQEIKTNLNDMQNNIQEGVKQEAEHLKENLQINDILEQQIQQQQENIKNTLEPAQDTQPNIDSKGKNGNDTES